MEKIILIDGKEVRFRSTAAVPRLYRIKFGRDIIQDMQSVQAALKKKEEDGGNIPPSALELFENVSYIMAKHADPEGVPSDVDKWFEGFDTFSIYQVLPEIISLWEANMRGMVDAKKKSAPRKGK